MNVQQIIDRILEDSCGSRRAEPTCDVLVSGSPEMEVTGIVTTFMATVDVIREAAALGANLIITHEPTYYTGVDRLEWLEQDPVYAAKRQLIEQHGMAIWRYHDHMHMAQPDRIYEGLLQELGWQELQVEERKPWLYELDNLPLLQLAELLKRKLGMEVLRIVGDPHTVCSRVGVLVGGASLGLGKEQMPMELMREGRLDAMICGEITEWTLCAYVNDAAMLGMKKAMLIVGHERTEEWGMKQMAEWLRPLAEGISVVFVDAREPFRYV